ncbi:MAG TPA: hypothetical protein VFA41_02585 [Ktedonobacteraceae bacterium]|nr:hypothetical protein [Ktedonobacteraceae bacterium]
MVYSRRNIADEQQEAYQKAMRIAAVCQQFQIELDPIEWQELGLWTVVKVNTVEIAPLLDLGQRESEDLLRLIQMKLFAHAALETFHAGSSLKAVMWSPVEVVKPQAFLSLWVITLETDERIPVLEIMRNGQRVYEPYQFDGNDGQQLAQLFGPLYEGEYHQGKIVTIKERERQYTGKIIYSIPPGKMSTSRKNAARGYRTVAGTTYTNDVVARYIVDCNDGFPHIVYQSQIVE